MTAYVVDASVAVKWLIYEESSDRAITFARSNNHFIAPRMIMTEVANALARKATETFGIDQMGALRTAFASVRRAGTISIIGVYGGEADPFPMMDLFDKGVTLRMGQAHVKRWVDDLMPLLTGDDDPLGVDDLVTHRVPLEQAPHAYEIFKKKEDGCIKVVLKP